MRYDSVLLYADEGQPRFSRFRLPMLCPGNPNDKMVRVRVIIGKNGGTMVDDDFTDKEIIDGDEDVDFFDSRDDMPMMPMMAPTVKGHLQGRRRGRRE